MGSYPGRLKHDLYLCFRRDTTIAKNPIACTRVNSCVEIMEQEVEQAQTAFDLFGVTE
ncbi:MAG: hypothetical protein WCC94_07130 [Candidatus Bathyarchaeia archaeon]